MSEIQKPQNAEDLVKTIKMKDAHIAFLEMLANLAAKDALSSKPDADYMFHKKSKNNTSIKFMDGKTITVHKAEDDEDSLETAVAYAIAIKVVGGKSKLQRLVKLVKEVE